MYDFNKLQMNRIKDILKEKGITQQDLANKLGVTRISIVKTLANENPTQNTLERIATALNVPMWQLFAAPEEVQANPESNGTQIICPHCKKAIPLEIGIRNEAHDNGTTTKQ